MLKNNSFCYFFLIVFAGLSLFACQANSEITNIKVNTVTPIRANVRTERIMLSNCSSTSTIVKTLGSEASMEKVLVIDDNIAASRNGLEYEIGETLRLRLEIEVEDAHQIEYETTRLRLESTIMNLAPGKQTVFIILWERLQYHSGVSFSYQDDVYHLPYRYELVVPKVISQTEIGCTGILTEETATIQPSPGVATDEPTGMLLRSFYLYAGPSTTSGGASGKLMREGDEVYVKSTVDGEWFLVQTKDGVQGWVFIDWIEIKGPISTIPIVTLAPSYP